jgi:hypothetical protein
MAKFLTREYSRFFLDFDSEHLAEEKKKMVRIEEDVELEEHVPNFSEVHYEKRRFEQKKRE